ncbi:FCS-Like Zinc finger 13 [Ricinus communis]|uniref:FLZ-type domain-containing protein n=1 Tax=Ricinus communis TaxID=3988 RepID=B9RR72_RICCO|nr:FCS-Like Zinc finger 13 [Ricinus communis]EEF46243.1 conserved hypothetical protein [Ricinus communis]|eukprot:XP_002516241.1 uncharacterized protein LOC8259077 [Ricinus communis]
MLGKRTNPMIGRLSELLVSGNRAAGFLDVATAPSPRSPLDYRIQSPRGLKNYDLGGVGLGIVAALEKSTYSSSDGTSSGHEILAKYAILCSSNNTTRSDPIPVKIGLSLHKEMLEIDSLDDYTYVTTHGPDNKSMTKVYYDHGQKGHRRIGFDSTTDNSFGVVSVIKETPAPARFVDEVAYPTSDFLSSCHLCKKKLHGKDIYMYRGEKAFCSAECRSRQIMIDERKEQCRSEVQRSADVSSSPYTTSPIFSAGILAI